MKLKTICSSNHEFNCGNKRKKRKSCIGNDNGNINGYNLCKPNRFAIIMFDIKSKLNNSNLIRKDVFEFAFPVVTEQVLIVLMGVVNAIMASRIGTEAVSGIGMVDSITIPVRIRRPTLMRQQNRDCFPGF